MLKITKGYNAGATFRLGQRTLTIGRGVANMIQLIDDNVSRRHAMVQWRAGDYLLVDLSSHNGIHVNGERVAEISLSSGDRLRLGTTELEMLPDDRSEPDATLQRKVADKGIVGAATHSAIEMIGPGRAEAIEETISRGLVVELDDFHAGRDVLINKFLFRLGRATLQGKPLKEQCEWACNGVAEFLQPDRLIVFEVAANKRAKPIANYFSPTLSEEQRKRKPYLEGLAPVVNSLKRVLINNLAAETAQAHDIGTMAAVPVVDKEGQLAIILYLDSFAENRQAFIAEDLDLLTRVGKALQHAI